MQVIFNILAVISVPVAFYGVCRLISRGKYQEGFCFVTRYSTTALVVVGVVASLQHA